MVAIPVLHNFIRGCFPAIYITSSQGNLSSIDMLHNQITECLKGISFWVIFPIQQVNISHNQISLTHRRGIDPGFICGIEVPNGNAANYTVQLANAAAIQQLTISHNRIISLLPTDTKEKSMTHFTFASKQSNWKTTVSRGSIMQAFC
jgi:hypothetical protein